MPYEQSPDHLIPYAPTLSPTEVRALRLLMLGWEWGEIAEVMGVTEGTIKQHIHRSYKKLGVGSRRDAIMYVTLCPEVLRTGRVEKPLLKLSGYIPVMTNAGMKRLTGAPVVSYKDARRAATVELKRFIRELARYLINRGIKRINAHYHLRWTGRARGRPRKKKIAAEAKELNLPPKRSRMKDMQST